MPSRYPSEDVNQTTKYIRCLRNIPVRECVILWAQVWWDFSLVAGVVESRVRNIVQGIQGTHYTHQRFFLPQSLIEQSIFLSLSLPIFLKRWQILSKTKNAILLSTESSYLYFCQISLPFCTVFIFTLKFNFSSSIQLLPTTINNVLSSFYVFSSVTCSVMSDSLWHHEPQQAMPPSPSSTPGVHPNTCPSSRWYQPNISSSVIPFSSCPQSFPASGSFQMRQLFASSDQSIAVSASASVFQWIKTDLI